MSGSFQDRINASQVAQRWYGNHRDLFPPRERNLMVDACALHLIEALTLSQDSARQHARQALAELEADAQGVPGFIDIDRSTAQMLLLRDSQSRVFHMITLPELFALVAAREQHTT